MAKRKAPIVEIAYRTWCINEYGMDALFLLEGEDKALLIDTGTGVMELPEVIQGLTDKPVVVAITHGHVDHAGGMYFFPEVYLHPDDFRMAKSISVEARQDYVNIMNAMSGDLYQVSAEDVRPRREQTRMLPLKDGDVIHLGNRDIEVLETPGHTPGGLSFLDKKEKLIFIGDACNQNTLLAFNDRFGSGIQPKSDISDLKAAIDKILSKNKYYTRVYNGHVGYADSLEMTALPEHLVEEGQQLCSWLLEGKAEGTPSPENPFTKGALTAKNGDMAVQYFPCQVK